MVYEVSLISLSLICMVCSCCLAVVAWCHKDLRVSDIMQAAVSMVAFFVITWVIFMG